jgi:UDP-3-O-[3-hydroxymyristoyl] glucosamine N-acyltransferase
MYAKVQQWWVAQSQPAQAGGVHPSAVVHPTAVVHPSSHVGAHVCVAQGVVVGEGAVLEPGVVLGAGVYIGAHTRLCANVVVYHDCRVGAYCLVHAGAVIGADGFGFAYEAGQWVKIPQVGRVLVGDHVEIGANTTIDRGALDDTIIGLGVKLDNQIQIAHNVRIGDHTAMAGFAGVAGSTHIGARCMIGGAASILGHLHIADGTQVSANTCIMNSITEPGVYTGIYPAQPHKDWERTAATVRQLNKLRKQWRKG